MAAIKSGWRRREWVEIRAKIRSAIVGEREQPHQGPRSVSSLFFGSAETDTNIPPSWNSPFFHRYCTDSIFWVEYIHIRFGEPIKITR